MADHKNFIMTFDESVADRLTHDGFTLLKNENGKYTFLNNATLKFSEDENTKDLIKKIHYTNKICMV